MKSRVLETIKKHNQGYNCCQSVICTYADLLGIDEKTAFKISEGLGLGIGKMQRTCGAVTAMVLACGLKNSDGDLINPSTKRKTYDLSYDLILEFEKNNETSICSELKKNCKKSCNECIMDGARIIEKMLFKGQFKETDE